MATFSDGSRDGSFYTAVDLLTNQYNIMTFDATDASGQRVVVASGSTQKLLGTLNNKPKAKQFCEIVMRHGGGSHKVVASAAIAVGAYLTSTAAGTAVTTTTAGDVILGMALTPATAAGDVIKYMPMTDRI